MTASTRALPRRRPVRANRRGLGPVGLRVLAAISVVAVGVVVVVLTEAVSTRDVATYSPGLTLAVAASASAAGAVWLGRRHRDEPWLARWIAIAFVAKLGGIAARYWVFTDFFDGAGDADTYHDFGVRFVAAFDAGAPLPELGQFSGGTQFMARVTGWVYVVVGPNLQTGFIAFGVLAFWGAYLWYRAAVMSVPELDHKKAFWLVMLLPSVVFWPSSVGKEAPMMLAMGLVVYGFALLLQRQWFGAVIPLLAGGSLSLDIRPHVIAIFVAAGTAAIILGRSNAAPTQQGQVRVGRVVASVVLVVVGGFVVGAAADYLGIESLSVESVENRLDDQAATSTQGGSSFGDGSVSLTPAIVPVSLFTLLFRPFITEASSSLQIISSLENLALLGIFVLRFRSVAAASRLIRRRPMLLFLLLTTVFYAVALSSFGNFGLLMRQRSLVLPAVAVFVAVRPPVVENALEAHRRRRAEVRARTGPNRGVLTAPRPTR